MRDHIMLSENDRATSVVFVVGEHTNGNVQPCESSLFSKHVHEVSGSIDELIGLAFDGCYSLTSGEPVPSCQFQATTMCAGKETQFVLAASEEIYSWGVGSFGELGQGLCKTKVDNPSAIKHKASFTQLSCGDYHAAALDSIGNAYSWGQNFDRQLGLYTKKSTEFSRPNCRRHVVCAGIVALFNQKSHHQNCLWGDVYDGDLKSRCVCEMKQQESLVDIL